MERSSIDGQAEHGPSLLMGPAVSPRRRRGASATGLLAEPLPPFVRPARAASAPAAAPAAVSAPVAPEPVVEVPMAESLAGAPEGPVAAEPEDDLGLVRGADWGLSSTPEDAVADLAESRWDAPSEEETVPEEPVPEELPASEPELPELLPQEPPAPVPFPDEPPTPAEPVAWAPTVAPVAEPSAPPLESAASASVDDWSLAAAGAGAEVESPRDVLPAEPEPEASPPAERAENALAEAMSMEEGPALQEVAGRLERIANALREGRPIELFSSGSSDPLEVLIAGYALGYSEAFRRVNEERRKKE